MKAVLILPTAKDGRRRPAVRPLAAKLGIVNFSLKQERIGETLSDPQPTGLALGAGAFEAPMFERPNRRNKSLHLLEDGRGR